MNNPIKINQKKEQGLSVIVCTFNRDKYIKKCILSILHELDNFEYKSELIVVDNNSKDNTQSILSSLLRSYSFTVVKEYSSGLSFARNTGILNSRFNINAFIDDDAFVQENWAINIFKPFLEYSNLACVGGRILPEFEVKPEVWFDSRFHSLYSIMNLDIPSGPFLSGYGPVGANMAINMNLAQTKLFDTTLGRKENSLLSGEEVSFLRQFKNNGLISLYISDAKVTHVIPSGRLTSTWAKNRFLWGGISDLLSQPNKIKKFYIFIRQLFNFIKSYIFFKDFYYVCLRQEFIGTIRYLKNNNI